MIIQLYKIDEDEKSSDSRGQDWLTILSLSVSARGESVNRQICSDCWSRQLVAVVIAYFKLSLMKQFVFKFFVRTSESDCH